jgi:transposase
MRGDDQQPGYLFSYVSAEARVPADHPLRPMRAMVDEALRRLSPKFERLYATTGRPSIAPEKLLRASVLQMLYSIRSERQLVEQLQYNLLYQWFVGLSLDDAVWDASTFSKNRDRLLDGEIAQGFFTAVLAAAEQQHLLSPEHFTVDGTLLEAWASHKSFRPKDEPPPPPAGGSNPNVDFRGTPRTNDTHASRTDPDARLYKKSTGVEARLSYLGHVLMENRSGLVVGATATTASGTAEREAALQLLKRQQPRRGGRTVGADKLFDQRGFVTPARALGFTPHVAQMTATVHRASAIDGRTTRHAGYAVSQRVRKLVEQSFGWLKTVALLRKLKQRGLRRVRWLFIFGSAVYNLVRIRSLTWHPA